MTEPRNDIPRHILPAIVLAQFAGTSLWFASNAVLKDLTASLAFPESALETLTSAVQLGFIAGTLIFAFLAVADRISPRLLFLLCSVGGAIMNVLILWFGQSLAGYAIQRFCVGFMLAGIYPVGMKIAADWFSTGLGKALGYLVGALVLGTAFPHLLRGMGQILRWQHVMVSVSLVAMLGGVLLFLTVPDGPNRKSSARFDPRALYKMFQLRDFRSATFGYFGHMWELYAVWALTPFMLSAYAAARSLGSSNVSLWSAAIIGIGALGCVLGGLYSEKIGSAKVAFVQLTVSGLFCLAFPILFRAPAWIFLPGMLVWGATVVGDSPQYSTLSARTAPKEYVGSALTIMNCIGFSITVCSIFLSGRLNGELPIEFLPLILVVGPAFGLYFIRPLMRKGL